MTVIPTFAQSVPLHDNHIGTHMNPEQDCLHYCMPGVPQVGGVVLENLPRLWWWWWRRGVERVGTQ
jgi:hypothetical protein